jgi:hypothetical protein
MRAATEGQDLSDSAQYYSKASNFVPRCLLWRHPTNTSRAEVEGNLKWPSAPAFSQTSRNEGIRQHATRTRSLQQIIMVYNAHNTEMKQ